MENNVNRIVTIRDVAKRAGVSTATVSHVINETRFVSDVLIKRVKDAIADLGYHPNLLVAGLRSKKTRSIGLMIPSISNETFGGLAERLQRTFQKRGESLIICNTSYDENLEKQAIATFIMKKVDAAVIVSTSTDAKRFQVFLDYNIPVVLVDRTLSGLKADSIRLDYFEASVKVVNYLYEIGHRHICYVDRKSSHPQSSAQRLGYEYAMKILNLHQTYIVTSDSYSYDAGVRAGKFIMDTLPAVTAIYCYFDLIAYGVMRSILASGLQIPNDYSVVGCDAMPFTKIAYPSLSSLEFPTNEVAAFVAERVRLRLIEKESGAVEANMEKVIIPDLFIGESVSKPNRTILLYE